MNSNDKKIPHLLNWKYYSVVGFVFLIGIILMLFSEGTNNHWMHSLGEIGAFVAAAIASHIIYDRLIRKDEQTFIVAQIEEALQTSNIERNLEIKIRDLLYLKEKGILGIIPELHYAERFNHLEHELLFVSVFFPDIVQIQESLKHKILIGKIQKINFYLLDNRKGSAGIQLLKYRANTFDKVENFAEKVKTNISILCNLARTLLLDKHNLKEFNIYLYNSLPTLSLSKFESDIAYVSFFFYNKRAINSTQFKINMNEHSEFVNEIKCHLNFLHKSVLEEQKKANQKYKFNLLDETNIFELENIT